jgi:hypothetical protein
MSCARMTVFLMLDQQVSKMEHGSKKFFAGFRAHSTQKHAKDHVEDILRHSSIAASARELLNLASATVALRLPSPAALLMRSYAASKRATKRGSSWRVCGCSRRRSREKFKNMAVSCACRRQCCSVMILRQETCPPPCGRRCAPHLAAGDVSSTLRQETCPPPCGRRCVPHLAAGDVPPTLRR